MTTSSYVDTYSKFIQTINDNMNFIASSTSLKFGKINSSGEYTLDLSTLYGNYYIGFGLWNSSIEMKEMWLEKNKEISSKYEIK